MNYPVSYSNMDDARASSMTLPDPWAIGDDYLNPNFPVPQRTYPDTISGYPTAGAYVPDLSAADDAAISMAPTTEMGAFAKLPPQADFTNFVKQVSSQCVGTLTWTYRYVPQDSVDPWSMPDPCVFLHCVFHKSFIFTGCESKAHCSANSTVDQLQLVGDQYYTRVVPLAAYSATTTPDASANASD